MINSTIKDINYLDFNTENNSKMFNNEDKIVLNESLELIFKNKSIGRVKINNLLYNIYGDILFIYIKLSNEEKKIILQINKNDFDFNKLKIIIENFNYMNRNKDVWAVDFHDKERASVLSLSSKKSYDLRGFLRLIILLMFYNYFRMILDNFMDYRLVFLENFKYLALQVKSIYLLFHILIIIFWLFSNYLLQRIMFKIQKRRLANIYMFFSTLTILVVEPYILNYMNIPIHIRCIILFIITVFLFKLISYCHVLNNVDTNLKWLKKENFIMKDRLKNYISESNFEILSNNRDNFYDFLTLKKFIYFLFIPTLCFQLKYAHSKIIRKFWLVRKIIEYLILSLLNLFFVLQWILPLLKSLGIEIMESKELNYLKIFSIFLRLSTPNTLCWLIMFYSTFHILLNILSEILYFGDRVFYFDWWNCKGIEEYWRLWNLPVHHWFIRHVHYPLKSLNIKRHMSGLIIFIISGLVHEYVCSGALYKFYIYFFIGLIMQYFAIVWEKIIFMVFKLKESNFGNYSFWISFCLIGQPMLIAFYYIEFIYIN